MIAKTSSESLQSLLDGARITLIAAGVPPLQINIRKKKFQISSYVKAYDWLHDLKLSEEYTNYVKVRALLPEETWTNYITCNYTGLAEMDMLLLAGSKLKKRWKKDRPPLFNKDRETDNE